MKTFKHSKLGMELVPPKYYIIKKFIIDGIKKNIFKAEMKLPSENKLAEKFQVNQNTAKKALRELELMNIIYRIQGKGSFVCAKDKESSNTIALLINNVSDIFYSKIVEYISKEAYKLGLELIFCNTEKRYGVLKSHIDRITSGNKINGFIAVPVGLSVNNKEYKIYKSLAKSGVPFVLLFPQCEVPFANTVSANDEESAYLCVKHLIELGHKDIAFITHSNMNDAVVKNEFKGYKRALNDAKIEFNDALIFKLSDALMHDGYNLAERLIKNNNIPSACYTVTNHLAIGMQKSFRESHFRIPEDIAIAASGCLDIASEPNIAITNAFPNVKHLCKMSMDLLINVVNNKDKEVEHLILNPEFHIRKSSGYNNKKGEV